MSPRLPGSKTRMVVTSSSRNVGPDFDSHASGLRNASTTETASFRFPQYFLKIAAAAASASVSATLVGFRECPAGCRRLKPRRMLWELLLQGRRLSLPAQHPPE